MTTQLRTLILAPVMLGIVTIATNSVAVLQAQGPQLDRLAAQLRTEWFRSAFSPVRSSLDEGRTYSFDRTLSADWEYAFQGTCDDDCTDLDLELSLNGEVVARDTEPDDTPQIRFIPAYSATYRVTVKMYTCGIEPCAFAVGTYRR